MGEEKVLKEELVGYLKSKMNMLQGILVLSDKRLVLDAHRAGVGGLGVIGAIAKHVVEKKSFGFNLEFSQIKEISQGKHGFQKNVLQVKDNEDNEYRIIVKKYPEWEEAIKSKM